MQISDAILATLAYYDGLEHPLTVFELYRFLINPQRLKPRIPSIETITLKEIEERVDELSRKGSIVQELGFYSLKDRPGLGRLRLEREKIAAQKWRKCLLKTFWLQPAPWVRGVFVSGSLALGTVSEQSDFDMLVIVEPGRLYLARLFLLGLASLIGARRTRFETSAPDKFCFNHYLTTDALTIKHESLYNAQTYAHLVPSAISPSLAGEFFAANLWINKYLYNFTPHQRVKRRRVLYSSFLRGIARAIEIIIDATIGDSLERLTRWHQQGRIDANPATHAPGGRVVYTDTELEFHPRSFERVVLEHYNTNTRRLTLAMNSELDSGLNV